MQFNVESLKLKDKDYDTQGYPLLLVGTNREKIEQGVSMLLDDADTYRRMSEAVNPYGDGLACKRIMEYLAK